MSGGGPTRTLLLYAQDHKGLGHITRTLTITRHLLAAYPSAVAYVATESPRGEQGCYLVSEGGPKPWRVHFRAPSFVALEATATCLRDTMVADLIAVVGSLDAVMGDTDR